MNIINKEYNHNFRREMASKIRFLIKTYKAFKQFTSDQSKSFYFIKIRSLYDRYFSNINKFLRKSLLLTQILGKLISII